MFIFEEIKFAYYSEMHKSLVININICPAPFYFEIKKKIMLNYAYLCKCVFI